MTTELAKGRGQERLGRSLGRAKFLEAVGLDRANILDRTEQNLDKPKLN